MDNFFWNKLIRNRKQKKEVSRSWAARGTDTALLAAAAEQPQNYSGSRSPECIKTRVAFTYSENQA